MSEPTTPRQRLIGVLVPAERDRLCRLEELLADASPLGIVRAGMLLADLFVPAPGPVGRFVQVLTHFSFQPLPARLAPPEKGDLYVLRDGDSLGFVTNLWLDGGNPQAPPTTFDGLSEAGERRIECAAVDFWLRLPGAG